MNQRHAAFEPAPAPRHLWAWAEPVVYDTLLDAYRRAIPAERIAQRFARDHARAFGLMSASHPDLDALDRLAERAGKLGFGVELIHDANRAVTAELAELVRSRYRTKPRQRHLYAVSLADLDLEMAAALSA